MGYGDNIAFLTSMYSSGVFLFFTGLMIMFFIIATFAKDKIENLAMFRRAIVCFSLCLVIPFVAYCVIFVSSIAMGSFGGGPSYGLSRPSGGEGLTEVVILVVAMVTPMLFVASVVMGLFSMTPKIQFGRKTSSVVAEEKKHPLDD